MDEIAGIAIIEGVFEDELAGEVVAGIDLGNSGGEFEGGFG